MTTAQDAGQPDAQLRERTFSWADPAASAAAGAGLSGAEGTVVHLGRRTALAEARITDAAGKVYVTATSSCLLIRPGQP